ncbi:FKBP-type peptidyl-prolyl cis-trans isomerase [Streptomyces liangshanensis]|uniref:FKBP-type peptidyl-prolyl cis-trans isomerase n=1 Tax=Streptomyces liangshanensis TaxID=2717324 RepID=UPI0036DC2E2F
MNHTKNKRRLAVALAVPALLLSAVACGSDDKSSGGGDNEGASKPVVKVEGAFGAQPKITTPKDAKPSDKLIATTVIEGKGAKVTKDNFVRLDFEGQTMKDGQSLGGSWSAQAQAQTKGPRPQLVAQLNELGIQQSSQRIPAKVLEAVIGQKTGSRVEVEGTAQALIGAGLNPQSGIKATDGLVWVVDVVNAASVDAKAEAKGTQAAPKAGFPTVKATSQKAATITIPKGEKAPKELEQQVLIQGTGPEVKAGEGLIGQYTGVKWEDGKKFDSSWDHGGAIAFQIGTGSVVAGWDKGLTGKHVGDRVELVIPPKDGYGAVDGNELQKNTLVFVVDIVGKV